MVFDRPPVARRNEVSYYNEDLEMSKYLLVLQEEFEMSFEISDTTIV